MTSGTAIGSVDTENKLVDPRLKDESSGSVKLDLNIQERERSVISFLRRCRTCINPVCNDKK